MKLTRGERLALWNQYEILKNIDPDNEKEYDTNQEILSNGYEQYYSDINPSIYEEVVSREVSREVEEILNVFRAIAFSCIASGYKPKSSRAQFQGFDGNESTGHFGVARFIRRTQGRWDELKACPDNSHTSSSLPQYRAMLREWRRLGEKYELTEAEIEQIAEAR